MGQNKKMYVGVNMSSTSVGMAVTDEHYNLYRIKGQDFWCSRTFSKADTAEKQRLNRIMRRNLQREKARLGALRDLFANEIEKVDAGFYTRLDESFYHLEDKSTPEPYSVFCDKDYTDADYFHEYPTIFHLRKELLHPSKPAYDVRLVYLALANMFKHRGHFINDAVEFEGSNKDIQEIYINLAENAALYNIDLSGVTDTNELLCILTQKGKSRVAKLDDVSKFMNITKKDKSAYELLKLICGIKGTLYHIYGPDVISEENKKMVLGFRESNYEDASSEAVNLLGDDYFSLIENAKQLHDAALLFSLIGEYPYLSDARAAIYEEHKEDLALLKKVMRKYAGQGSYDDMFRFMKEGSYSAYVGSTNAKGVKIRRNGGKGRSQKDLYDNIKKVLKDLPAEDKDVMYILDKIENETFMQKQNTSANTVIPNSVHVAEMKAILKNAEAYLPFLKEVDETGLSVSEKIVQLFTFHIPYYVGPLGTNGHRAWAKRRQGEEKGKIYPWNFEQKIDTKKASEDFILNMVRHCTYVSGERCLPKQSLLYERFMVLNELNNLTIDGQKPTVQEKQQIFNELFTTGKKISLQALKIYLYKNDIIQSKDVILGGIDNGFTTSLSSVGKFKSILGDAFFTPENQKMAEQIIFYGTVYGNDKKFFKERIEKEYGHRLSKDQIKRIVGFKFNGWGRLSKTFLELSGSCGCGECSLIEALWNTNHNLKELLSDQYDFKDSLERMTKTAYKPLSAWSIDDLDDTYLSPSVKRMVWQTIKMLKETCELTGKEPDKIFVEMLREDGEKVQKKSRKKKLISLYTTLKKEDKEWAEMKLKEINEIPEADFKNRKLYLYYMQQCKCMYSGEPIDRESLMNDNLYNIDHIYPKHYIKDDSIENNLVLVRKPINKDKNDDFPLSETIQKKQTAFWRMLCRNGFITMEKYNRLVRTTPFTDEEKAAFINRQIVEIRQGTKMITQILSQAFPDTRIVFVKADLVSEFKKKFEIYKSNELNTSLPAKDAYLNIVVGNVYDTKFTTNPLNFIKAAKKDPKNTSYKYHMDKVFDYDVIRNGEQAWITENELTKNKVLKTMQKNSVIITKKTESHQGCLFNLTIYGKDTVKKNPDSYLPVKTHDLKRDALKYGGVTSVASSGYVLVEYKVQGQIVKSFEAIPIYLGSPDTLSEQVLLDYVFEILKKEYKNKTVTDLKICIPFIPFESKILLNGFHYYLGGRSGNSIILKNAEPLYLSVPDEAYLKKLMKAVNTNYYKEKKDGSSVITKEKNLMFFKMLCEKFTHAPYRNHQCDVYSSYLKDKDALFDSLNIEQQCFVISQIILWNTGIIQTMNLKFLQEKEHVASKSMNKHISRYREVVLIHQSATGMLHSRKDLLKL